MPTTSSRVPASSRISVRVNRSRLREIAASRADVPPVRPGRSLKTPKVNLREHSINRFVPKKRGEVGDRVKTDRRDAMMLAKLHRLLEGDIARQSTASALDHCYAHRRLVQIQFDICDIVHLARPPCMRLYAGHPTWATVDAVLDQGADAANMGGWDYLSGRRLPMGRGVNWLCQHRPR